MKNNFFNIKALFKWGTVILLMICLSSCATRLPHKTVSDQPVYKLIIDAGSSGSRIYVYKVFPNRDNTLPGVEFIDSKKVEPGISDYIKQETKVTKGLLALIAFAKKTIGQEYKKGVPLYVLATAGMRLEDENEQKKIIDKVRDLYKNIPFDLKSVKVITGKMEGLYSWLAVNYLDDRFDPSSEREGMIEMGGASTQITFVPAIKTECPYIKRKIRGQNYSVFSKSYLYLGQDQAKTLTNATDCHTACYPLNYPCKAGKGTGNFDECKECIFNRMNKLCNNEDLACVFEKEELPDKPLHEFIACSAFYYTFSFPGLGLNLNKINLKKLKSKGEVLCATEWDDLKKAYPTSKEKYLSGYCFNAAYFWALLSKGYKFDDTGSGEFIAAKNKINDNEISWTLGTVLDIALGYNP